MRLFQMKLLDEHLEDAGSGHTVVTSNGWSLLLARAESLRFTCIVDKISASLPTLALYLLGTNSDRIGEFTKTLFNQALVAGVNTITASYGPSDATYPPPRHFAVAAGISGGAGRKARAGLAGS